MNIKDLFNKKLENAKSKKDQQENEEERERREARELFRPVVEAMENLKDELSCYEDIKFSISDHYVDIYLGDETTLKTHRYGGSDSFRVEETNNFEYPEYDIIESEHEFQTAQETIEFLVEGCAEYVAEKGEETET